MYLWQKYKYKVRFLAHDKDFIDVKNLFIKLKPKVVAFDTETTGLHIVKDKPFLVGFGFHDRLYVYEPTEWRNNYFFKLASAKNVEYVIGHNVKFDYHMFRNFGTPVPESVNLGDTMTVARLTDYADSPGSMSLEGLAKLHVDESASFGSKAIREHINQLNRIRLNKIKEYVNSNREEIGLTYTEFRLRYGKKVQHVEDELQKHFDYVDDNFPELTYEDSYIDKPTLMINYLYDDIVMTLRLFNKLFPILEHVDKDLRTFKRENKLIRVVGDMESNGMNIDIEYLKESRKRVIEYTDEVYNKLWELADIKNIVKEHESTYNGLLANNPNFTVGQHGVIKDLFATKYKIGMISTDLAALTEISEVEEYPEEARKIASLIIELRTLNKWLSTYIEGQLNKLHNGRLYTNINNNGAVTGRVSSDLQQQPTSALLTADGEELFHPRKPFINDEGFKNYYIDFSNMELRVQAYYTMLTSGGDLNMCRAFIPFKYKNVLTSEEYDVEKDVDNYDSDVWVDDNGDKWSPVDLHTATTLKAFPHIKTDDDDFKSFRDLGKRANFLKNYGGGRNALQSSLRVSPEIAEALDKGYYEAFPKILDYQRWVDENIKLHGFVENLYGRRYYFQDTQASYRGYNYLIQGSCADYVKDKQIQLHEYLKDKESVMLMPIHDEIIFSIKDGEEYIIPELVRIMQDAKSFVPYIPMLVGVESSDTNWAEASEVIISEN